MACSIHEEEDERSNIGVVVGAKDIPSLRTVRRIVGDKWILCPGVGAQGGSLEDACDAGLSSDGGGLLVTISRGIQTAPDRAAAARSYRDAINACRQRKVAANTKPSAEGDSNKARLISLALGESVVQTGEFTLKSGRASSYFVNLGKICNGKSLNELARCLAIFIRSLRTEFDVFFGPAYKGIPIVTALAVAWFQLYAESKGICYNRKEGKDHGEKGLLIGENLAAGQRVLVIDDVITAGTSITESIGLLRSLAVDVVGAVTVIDREERVAEGTMTCAEVIT